MKIPSSFECRFEQKSSKQGALLDVQLIYCSICSKGPIVSTSLVNPAVKRRPSSFSTVFLLPSSSSKLHPKPFYIKVSSKISTARQHRICLHIYTSQRFTAEVGRVEQLGVLVESRRQPHAFDLHSLDHRQIRRSTIHKKPSLTQVNCHL